MLSESAQKRISIYEQAKERLTSSFGQQLIDHEQNLNLITQKYEQRMEEIKAKYERDIKAIDAKYPARSYVAAGIWGMLIGFWIGFYVAYLMLC